MKKALLLSVLSFCFISPAMAAGEKHWGYIGGEAAHRWGDLAAEFETCKQGVEQSPVNINEILQEALPALNTNFAETPLEVVNNGHTVQVNYAPGSGFKADGKDFGLVQFDFHTPSEHYIDGAPYPMEAQFVHKAGDGSVGIISVMMKVGKHNPVIEGVWQNVPVAGKTKAVAGVQLNAGALMPANKDYYQYDGSLTTPPCSEGVKWYVMKDPIEISADQLKAFQSVFPVNARPIQALGARVVKGN